MFLSTGYYLLWLVGFCSVRYGRSETSFEAVVEYHRRPEDRIVYSGKPFGGVSIDLLLAAERRRHPRESRNTRDPRIKTKRLGHVLMEHKDQCLQILANNWMFPYECSMPTYCSHIRIVNYDVSWFWSGGKHMMCQGIASQILNVTINNLYTKNITHTAFGPNWYEYHDFEYPDVFNSDFGTFESIISNKTFYVLKHPQMPQYHIVSRAIVHTLNRYVDGEIIYAPVYDNDGRKCSFVYADTIYQQIMGPAFKTMESAIASAPMMYAPEIWSMLPVLRDAWADTSVQRSYQLMVDPVNSIYIFWDDDENLPSYKMTHILNGKGMSCNAMKQTASLLDYTYSWVNSVISQTLQVVWQWFRSLLNQIYREIITGVVYVNRFWYLGEYFIALMVFYFYFQNFYISFCCLLLVYCYFGISRHEDISSGVRNFYVNLD